MSKILLPGIIKNISIGKKLRFKRSAGIINDADSWFNKNNIPIKISKVFKEMASRVPYENETGTAVTNHELAVRLFILWVFRRGVKVGNPKNLVPIKTIEKPTISISEISIPEQFIEIVDTTFKKLNTLMNEANFDLKSANEKYQKLSQGMFLDIKNEGADPELIKKIKQETKKIDNYLSSKIKSSETTWTNHGFGNEDIDIFHPIKWKNTIKFIENPKDIIKKGVASLKFTDATLEDKLDEYAIKIINTLSFEDLKNLIKSNKLIVKKEKNLITLKYDDEIKTIEDTEYRSGSVWTMPNIMFLYLNDKENFIHTSRYFKERGTIEPPNTEYVSKIYSWIQYQGLDEIQTTKRFIQDGDNMVPAYSGSGEGRVYYKPEIFEQRGFGKIKMKNENYSRSLFGTYLNGSIELMASGLPLGCNMMGDPKIASGSYPSKFEYEKLLKDLTWDDMYTASREYYANLQSKVKKGIKNYKETGHIILDCGNGWYWVDLKTNTSTQESNRMGHCGQDEMAFTLFSLRNTETKNPLDLYGRGYDPSKKYTVNKSWATIAVQRDGTFIQFKGHNNQSPPSSIYSQIESLLSSKLDLRTNAGFTGEFAKTKMVQPQWSPASMNSNPGFPKLTSGGDFKLVDMISTPQILKSLAKKRPEFFNWPTKTNITNAIDRVINDIKKKTARN